MSVDQQIADLKAAACYVKCVDSNNISSWLLEHLLQNNVERVVACDINPEMTLQTMNYQLVQNIAEAALTMWPDWFATETTIEPIVSHTASVMNTWQKRLKASETVMSRQWLRKADQACRNGTPPIFSEPTLTRQLRNLSRCLASKSLVVLVRINSPSNSPETKRMLSRVAEWFAAASNATTILIFESANATTGLDSLPELQLSAVSELEFDLEVQQQVANDSQHHCDNVIDEPVEHVHEVQNQTSTPSGQQNSHAESRTTAAADLSPNTVSKRSNYKTRDEYTRHRVGPFIGRPHPNSPGEQLMAKALQQDAGLTGLFQFNQRIQAKTGSHFIVDLLWKLGRVVIEIDGYGYHSNRPIFQSDRQRDFELVISDYIVLRVTHDEVVGNLPKSIEKIRTLVNWQRSQLAKGKPDAN